MDAPATSTGVAKHISERVEAGEHLQDVVQDVHRVTGRSESSLRSAFRRFRLGSPHAHGNSILTTTEERALIYTAQAFRYANAALTRRELGALVKDLWGKEVGVTWAAAWVARHKGELSTRACKALSDKRNAASVYDQVVDWSLQVEKFFKDHRVPPSSVLNYDECRLVMCGEQLAIKRVQSKNRERPNVVSTRNNTVASLLTFAAASGKPFLSVYVFRGRFGEEDTTTINFTISRVENRTRTTWPRFYGWTDTGFVDAPCFAAIMDLFCKEWRLQNPLGDAFLIGDQLAAHKQVDVVRAALRHGVHCWWLVANTSHWLQVLDDKPFALLKRFQPVLSQQRVIDALLTSQPVRDCFIGAAYEAERRAMTPKAIKAAFKNVGLFPFDRMRVMELAHMNLGMGAAGADVASLCVAAAGSVLRRAQMKAVHDREETARGRAAVKNAKIYSPQALLAADAKMRKAKAQEAKKKAAAAAEKSKAAANKELERLVRADLRKKATCRACHSRVRRGGSTWSVCGCMAFVVCPFCLKTDEGKAVGAAHDLVCSQK